MTEQATLKDLLIWVGRSYYSKANFIAEASSLGVCRRVPSVPNVEVGRSRCFLIIDDINGPEIFGYFVIRSIGYVVDPSKNLPEELERRGVKPISMRGPTALPVRGCGQLVFGATYLLSEEDFEKCKDLADKSDLSGNLILLDPPIPYGGKHFRGYRYCDGSQFLNGSKQVPVSRMVKRWKSRYKVLDEWA